MENELGSYSFEEYMKQFDEAVKYMKGVTLQGDSHPPLVDLAPPMFTIKQGEPLPGPQKYSHAGAVEAMRWTSDEDQQLAVRAWLYEHGGQIETHMGIGGKTTHALGGKVTLLSGDYIMREPTKGEFFAWPPEVFEKIWKPVSSGWWIEIGPSTLGGGGGDGDGLTSPGLSGSGGANLFMGLPGGGGGEGTLLGKTLGVKLKKGLKSDSVGDW